MNLQDFQEEVEQWAKKNFGNPPYHQQVFGLVEELGELAHALLKKEQNIRLDENHNVKIIDAIGDIVVFLTHLCCTLNLNLEACIETTWEEVKKRDWSSISKKWN